MIEWRTVNEAPEYEVSNTGMIRSRYTNRSLIGGHDKDGYRKIVLCTNGGRLTRRICALVCAAFHGPRKPGMVVRHKDGSTTNDNEDNVEWGTQKQNMQDKVRHGTAQIGARHPLARLSEDDVRFIRSSTMAASAIALRYDVSIQNIYSIRSLRTWSHVT